MEEHLGRLLAAWVEVVRRFAPFVVVAMLAASALALRYAVTHLEVNADTNSLVSERLPHKAAQREYHEAFPVLYENLLVVIDARTPEQAREAASALAQRLKDEGDSIRRAYVPGGGDFFERHAFLYLDTEELEDLADRLARVQPYLAGLARDGSLRSLADLMGRGVMAVRDGEVDARDLLPMFQRFGDALDAGLAERPYHLSWAEVVANRDLDARRSFVLVSPVLDFGELQPGKQSILAVRGAARELGLVPERGVTLRITGEPALTFEEWGAVRNQAAMAGLASFLLVSILLFIALRSPRLVLSTVVTLLVGLIFTAAFAALAIGHLNMISVAFAVLFIGLSVDFGIHLCLRYRDLLHLGNDHAEALRESVRDVGTSIVICAVTTAIGFFAFVPTDFAGVAELGVISGAGMFISLFCSLTLLPALISLRTRSVAALVAPRARASATVLASLPIRHPQAVRAVAVVLALGAVLVLPEVRFDHNPLRVRDPSTEAVQTFNELLDQGTTSPWTLNVIARDLASAERVAEQLRGLDEVERVVTLADFVPENQAEKLAIIEDVSLFLAPPPKPDGGNGGPRFAEQRKALLDFRARLAPPIAPEVPELEASAARLRERLDAFAAHLDASDAPDAALRALEDSLLGTLPEQLRVLEASLTAGPVSLSDLPPALVERLVTADGRVRVQVFPTENLSNNAALEEFVESVRSVAPAIAGDAVTILESGRAVVGAFQQAFLTAVVVIALLLLVMWRRVTDVALVLIPLGLAAVLTCAAAVLAGIPFNFADVIVLPLLFGIGIDSGIHLVHRARNAIGPQQNLLLTSTARAVAFSALTTIASFGSLAFASHRGMATLGQLLTLGVCITLVCNLMLLPALIELRALRNHPAAPSPGQPKTSEA